MNYVTLILLVGGKKTPTIGARKGERFSLFLEVHQPRRWYESSITWWIFPCERGTPQYFYASNARGSAVGGSSPSCPATDSSVWGHSIGEFYPRGGRPLASPTEEPAEWQEAYSTSARSGPTTPLPHLYPRMAHSCLGGCAGHPP
jgi:hypothetical protein